MSDFPSLSRLDEAETPSQREVAVREVAQALREKEHELELKEAQLQEKDAAVESIRDGKAKLTQKQKRARKKVENVIRKEVKNFWRGAIPSFRTAAGRQEKKDFIARLHTLTSITTILQSRGETLKSLKLTDKVIGTKLVKHCSYKRTARKRRNRQALGNLGMEGNIHEEEVDEEGERNKRLREELKGHTSATHKRDMSRPVIELLLTKYNVPWRKDQLKSDLIAILVKQIDANPGLDYKNDFKEVRRLVKEKQQQAQRNRAAAVQEQEAQAQEEQHEQGEGDRVPEEESGEHEEREEQQESDGEEEVEPHPEQETEETQAPRHSLSSTYNEIGNSSGAGLPNKRKRVKSAHLQEEEVDTRPKRRLRTRR